MALFTGDGAVQLFVSLPVAGINAAITDHFVMLFRDVADQTLYEFHNRNGLFHIFVVLMAVIMESDRFSVILVDS